jgi:hypothetical protein
MPFIYKYQVDVNGDYVLNGGNRVVEDSYEFAASGGFDWRRVASSTKKQPYVRSFQIKKFDNGDTWLLLINQKHLVGIYPSQDAALQVLLGCFTRVSASDLSALETMSYQLSQGYSFIDPAYNNLTLTRSEDDLVVTLSLINTLDPAIATPIVTWDDYSTPGSPDATTSLGAVTEPEGGTQVFTIVGGWTASAENNYIQAFLEDSGVGVVVNSNVLIKDELDPSGTLSVSITNLAKDGPPEATWDGQTYAGAAYATPQWTVEDWPEGVTPSYQYAWSYQIDNGPLVSVGGSGPTLDLALVPYGAIIKCGAAATAYVNGKVVNSLGLAPPMVTVAVSDETLVEVVDIKLFAGVSGSGNTAQPVGQEVSSPNPNTEYYAFAYDGNGALIQADVTWTGPIVADAPIVPGAGFTGDIAETTIDGGGSYTKAGDAKAAGWWSETPYQLAGSTYGDSVEIGVVAEHYNGIEKVGFIADNGSEVQIATPTVTADGLTQYRATVDMSGKTPGDTVEVRAILYPYHGNTRVLQGEISDDTSVADTSKMGAFGMKITKINSIVTTNVTTGTTLRDALNALGDISTSPYQHRLVFSDSEVLAGTTNNSTMHDYIPTIIEGSIADRGVMVTDNVTNQIGPFAGGSYHIKNITWDGSSVNLRPQASVPVYISMDDSTITTLVEAVPENTTWLDSDGVSVNIVGNNIANTKSSSKLTWTGAVKNGRTEISSVSSSPDRQKGIWLENSTISCETGDAVKWVKNCDTLNNTSDNFHGGCALNLDIQSGQMGYRNTYPLTTNVLNFVPNKSYPNGAYVVGQDTVDDEWKVFQNNTGGDLATADFETDSGWYSSASPHADGWQGRPNTDGTYIFDNLWLEGLTIDTDSNVQPFIYRNAEVLANCVWKRWALDCTQEYSNSLLSEVFTPMDHWIVDNCVWWPNVPGDIGELHIVWNDLDARGWGVPNPNFGDMNGIGCRNTKWTNSEIKDLSLDSTWDDDNTFDDFADWVTQLNSNAGDFIGWDIDVDAYTMANSYFAGDGPVAPFNASTTAGAGIPEEGSTISVNTSIEGSEPITLTYVWDLDGNVVLGEDTDTYPKTGTIPVGDVGKVPTCTVTYTNAYGSDVDAHVFAAITPAGGSENWDTNEDGIFKVSSASNTPNGEFVQATTAYGSTSGATFQGWFRDNNMPTSRYWDGTADTVPPAIAVWNATDSVWLGWSTPTAPGVTTAETVRWDVEGAGGTGYWSFASEGKTLYVVYLTQAPTDFASWGDYDGPTGPAEDWDTHEVGAGTVEEFITSGRNITFNASYPSSTNLSQVNAQYSVVKGIRGNYSGITNMPPFVAVYYTQAQVDNTAVATPGWYVCQETASADPNYTFWAPYAWPTGGADGAGNTIEFSNIQFADGPIAVVALDQYNGSIGNGGTDSWTEPTVLLGPTGDDWDTYEEGAGTVPALSTSDQTVTYDSNYPNQNASWALRVTNVGGNWPFQYAPGTNFMSAADKATMSPYVAIYCQADEFNGRGNAAGWYVFGPGVDNNPGENGTIDYQAPVAWPTGANDGTGKLDSNVSGVVNCVVWLSDYTGSTGDGGTDSWTEPTDLLTP